MSEPEVGVANANWGFSMGVLLPSWLLSSGGVVLEASPWIMQIYSFVKSRRELLQIRGR